MSLVLGGKLYALILGLLLTPVIARLYSPADYGEFALYNMVVQNLVVVGTLSLPLAISTVNKKELSRVFSFTILIILIFALLFSLILFSFRSSLDYLLSTSLFSQYWGLMLIGFITTSIISALASLNIQLRRFKFNTGVNVSEVTAAKSFNLIGGFMKLKGLGLILSDTISKLISLLILIIKYPHQIRFFVPNLKMASILLLKLKKFPLYLTPSQWVGTISNQAVIWFVAYQFDKNNLGQLTMAIGLLGIPLNLLSNSFQPVITERLVNLRDGQNSYQFFKKMAFILLIFSSFGFVMIYFLPSSFFTLFLGDKWNGVNSIINIYCWYYIILLIEQAFSNGFIIFNKQKEKLLFNILDLTLLVIGALVFITYQLKFQQVITLFVALKILMSLMRVTYLWNIIKTDEQKGS